MRWIVLVVCGLASVTATRAAHAQPQHLAPGEVPAYAAPVAAPESEPPSIDVLTFGVGELIFEKFGHAAICLRYANPEHPTVCFNYGVTNFSAGSIMVWNFLRTQQQFWVEPTSLDSMVSFYEDEDRDIWRQTLPIHGAQARAIEAKLWSDSEEAHKFYYYDHFYDNCTTRLRDMIDQAAGGALRADSDASYPLTFRELGRRGLAGLPPLVVGTDLVAGRELDRHPTMWQAMFHPDIFRQQLAVKLGAEPELLYKRRGPAFPVEGPSGRLGLFAAGLVFALPLLLAQWRRRWQRTAVAWSSLLLVVLGVLVWGLAILSSIPAVRFNEVVLVVMPLDLALPFLGAGRRRRYALFRFAELAVVALLAAIGILHQPLWTLLAITALPMAILGFDLPHGLRSRLANRQPLAAPGERAPAAIAEPAAGP
jgi:hypothetical protein